MSAPLAWWQRLVLVALRSALGWHLFLQGYGKLTAVQWTAHGYLASASGPIGGLFRAMAQSPLWLAVGDVATVWGLMATGTLLMLGLLSRLAALGAAALLLLFYLASPPGAGGFLVPTLEGVEWYVNKLLLEVLALVVVASFPTGQMAGLDLLMARGRFATAPPREPPPGDRSGDTQW